MGRNKTLREAANGYAFDLDEGDLNTNRDTFIAGAKWAIDKASKWMEDNLVQCWIEDFLYVQFKHHEHQEKENVLADFRKAMEE